MDEINSNIEVKPKKKGWLYVLIAILFLGLGTGLGFGLFKYLDKKDAKEETKQEEKQEVEDPVKEKDEVIVNNFDGKEKIDLSNFKEYKKDVQKIKLNDSSYDLVTIYYTNKNQIAKSVTFNNVKVVEDYIIYNSIKSKYVDKYIKEDIDYTKKTLSDLKDAKSSEKYLLFYYKSYALVMDETEEDDPWYESTTSVSVIRKNGKVLFDDITEWSLRNEWLVVSDKKDVLDRDYMVSICETEFEDEEEDLICDGYIIYQGKEDSSEIDNLRGREVEFKSDHFYTFRYKENDKDVCDYKYSIENGVLKEELLNKYNITKHLGAAGAD